MTTTTTSPADPFTYNGRRQRMIPDEATGEMRPYQRVSTFAKTLSDSGGLLAWKAWMTLKGAALDGSEALVQQALHAERTPAGIIEQLAELGGSKAKAEVGTRRHQVVAMALTGADLTGLPPQARAELDAILRLIERLGTVQAVEFATVCDQYQTAGSCDLVLTSPTGQPIVADLKTGARLSTLDGAVQLAAHARSRYWIDGQRGDWVAPTRPRLVLIHAPQDGTPPRAVDIDPDQAKRAADLAAQVRDIRKELR